MLRKMGFFSGYSAAILPSSFCQHPLNVSLQVGGRYHRLEAENGGAVAGDE